MKRIILSAVLLGLPLLACDKTVIDNVPFERYDFSSNSDGGSTKIPVKPFLGDVLDRVGRPGVNTLLTAPLLAPVAPCVSHVVACSQRERSDEMDRSGGQSVRGGQSVGSVLWA